MHGATDSIVDCGVDYITVTSSGRHQSQCLVEPAIALLKDEVSAGNIKRGWSMAGFTGFAAGSVQTGERGDELIVRLSSAVARENWRAVYEQADNCSRLDVQVTVRGERDPARTIALHDKQARRFAARTRRRCAVSMFRANDQSSTLYLGKRISDRFGRIYDKHHESKLEHYQGCTRYEVEFKNERAASLATQLYHASDEAAQCAYQVSHFFRIRGCSSPFIEAHCEEPQRPANEPLTTMRRDSPRSRSDASRSLQWLAEGVRPRVQFLIERGMIDEVLQALGLSTHVRLSATKSRRAA